jgi:hypothetical protein
MEGNAVLRLIRALTLATVMLGSGVAGHVAAGGSAPATSALLPVFVLLTAAAAPLLDVPASARRVTALVLSGQGLLHVALQVLGGTAVDVAGHSMLVHVDAAGGPASSHHLHPSVASAPWGSALAVLTGTHPGMLLAHAAATLAIGLWLAAGERAAWTLVALAALPVVDAWVTLGKLSSGGAGAFAVPRAGSLPRAEHQRAARPSLWSGGGVSRRGPPCPSAA